MRIVLMLMSPSALARKTLAVCMGVALSACSTLPAYQKPDISVPAHYAGAAGWALATPADTQPRGPWWTVFGDSQLNELESRIDVSNQTVKKAVAQLQQARAFVDYQRAGFFPSVTAGASESRFRTSQNVQGHSLAGKTVPDYATGLSASWEPDLFGRVKDATVNAKDNAQASAADLEGVRLSMTSDLAIDYFDLRSLDTQKKLFDDTVTAYAAALNLLNEQLKNG